MRWFGRDAESGAWAEHEARAKGILEELGSAELKAAAGSGQRASAAAEAWADRLLAQPEEVVGSALMVLIRRASRGGSLPWAVRWNLAGVSRRRWSVSREDAKLAARTAVEMRDDWDAEWVLRVVGAMLRRTGPLDDESVGLVEQLIVSVDGRQHLPIEKRRSIRADLSQLLPAKDAEVDTSVLVLGDGWSATVLPELGTLHEGRADVTALLRHLVAARGSRPGVKWAKETARLLASKAAESALRMMLGRVIDAEPVTQELAWGPYPVVVSDRNADMVRAAAWATVDLDPEWTVPTLTQVAVRSIASPGLINSGPVDKVANACILTLGRIATPEAVAALHQLADRTRDTGIRKRVAAALTIAAEATGLTPGELVERNIHDQGLDATGKVALSSGSATAEASVEADLKITVRWGAGVELTAKPAADLLDGDVNAIKRQVKELRGAIAAERRRVEGLFAAGRPWKFPDWRRYYLDHPLTGRITQRLIWRFGDDIAGVPSGDGILRTVDGEVPLPESAAVTLWHPASATTAEVELWRTWLLERPEIRQPFKQAFREVYLLTPAERETRTHSNRFAAHVLHYQQVYALFKERAWAANYLGPYDGGYDGQARREFPDNGVTATFEHFQIDADTGAFHTDLCSTDRVWFFRTGDRSRTPVPIEEIPPLVFSETMRDVDLFVGVTSIALDPTWADRGEDPFHGYWLRASFGELSATAQVRRDVLARLLPKLKVANRVEPGDRYVRVRGNLGTYKVHLGSANILIEPDDRYLCIVPRSSGRTKRPMLPFEGDDVLTVVISKVLLLAADDKVKDPDIVRQLRSRS